MYIASKVTSDFSYPPWLRQKKDKQQMLLQISFQNVNYCIIMFAILLVMYH